MRGKDLSIIEPENIIGITPAYAGKSSQERKRGHGIQGSPPPMRGKVCDTKIELDAIGITPAYAGKSRVDFPNVVKL